MADGTTWLAVDWGTSNLRVWGMRADGTTAFLRVSDKGMGKLTPEQFAGVLAALVADAVSVRKAPLDAWICGMAGARQGWMEAPYLDTPADLGSLAYAAVRPPMPDASIAPRILPGVCQKPAGREDVMRGEETQILGLSALVPDLSGLVILPGTHAKWVLVNGRRIERFATSVTGELFEVLRAHSVLRLSLNGARDGAERNEGFAAGLAAGVEAPERLPSLLFKVRAGALLSGRSPDWNAGYLSGLLIGAEIGGQRVWIGDDAGDVPLIGSPGLCALYQQGLAQLGIASHVVDAADATLAGLKLARELAS
jgi:2-dehydro-3-deoxygalactonokinase